jgi:hypothetical protein
MRILITGSRNWDNFKSVQYRILEAISEWIDDHPGLSREDALSWVTIVHGGCPTGADRIADIFARKAGIPTEVYEAQWNKFQKRAGFVRNRLMVNKGADVCLAFNRDKSRGTVDCRDQAKKAGIPTETFDYVLECERWPVLPAEPYRTPKGI